MNTRSFSYLVVGTFIVLAACSSDDDNTSSSSSSTSSSSGSSGGTSSSGSSKPAGECTSEDQCQELTCTCQNFAGAKVRKCTNGVCAKSCSEAGCS